MSEMEIDYAGQIVEWALCNFTVPEFVSQSDMINKFWLDKLSNNDYSNSMSCDGDSKPFTDWDFKGEYPEC